MKGEVYAYIRNIYVKNEEKTTVFEAKYYFVQYISADLAASSGNSMFDMKHLHDVKFLYTMT